LLLATIAGPVQWISDQAILLIEGIDKVCS